MSRVFKKQLKIIVSIAILSLFLFPKITHAANINFSLEAWVKPASSIATKAILVKNNEMRLVTDGSGNPSCQIYSDSWQTAAVSSSALSLGAWQNVACTYDGSNVKVYIDGVLKDTEEETANVNNTANGMQVGNDADAGTIYGKFQGQTDSVRIYNRALSANEIKAHYNLGNLAHDGGMEDGTVGQWSQASEGSELVSNIGFETAGAGDPDFWANWTENAGDGALANETTNKRSGDDAMKATAGASADAYAKQAVVVTAGKTYKATFWTRGDGTYSGRYAIYDATNLADIVATTTASVTGTTYTQITKYFTAPTGCESAELYLYCPSTNTGVAYFDDISIVSAQTASAESGTVKDEDGLVGGWNFEDNATDVSGNGNNGTLYGDAAYSASGRFGKAISLDGTGDFVEIVNNASLKPSNITAEAWFKTSDTDGVIMHQKIIGSSNWAIYLGNSDYGNDFGDGILGVARYTGSYAFYTSGTAVNNNNWHHVVYTRSDNFENIYLDGAQKYSTASPRSLVYDSDNFIKIGAYGSTGGMIGLIDSPRIYNRALSASEIAAQYSLGRNKFDNYSAKIKLAADDSNSYLDESLTNGSDYLLSYWYKMGEDNINPINFTVSGAGAIAAEQNLQSTAATGLVGAWNFESSATPSVDFSGNSNSLTWNGTAAQTAGKYGYAIDLDGDSDYLNKTDADSLDLSSSATIQAWVKLDDLAAQHSIVDKGTNYGVHIDTSGYLVWDNGTEYKDTTAISATTWTHIAVTNNGTTAKYYINGIYKSEDTAGFAAINASDLRVGYDGTNYFQGLIDSLRIYNRALTASEVYDSYKAGNWRKYELSFEADAGDASGNTLFKFIQNGTTSGNSIVYTDNFRVDKNLVDKGGMEGTFTSGVAAGWEEAGSTATPSESADERTGAKAQAVLAGDTSNNVAQTVTVESGKWYTFSAFAKVDSGNAYIELSGAATKTLTITNTQYLILNTLKHTFKVASTSLVIELYADATKTGIFDDISLIELDNYTAPTTPTTTTPSTATNSYGAGRWGESSGALLVDGADTLTYPTANNIYADEGTVAFWVKPALSYNKYGENKYLWTLDDGTNQVARIYYNYSDYKFYFEVYDGSSWTTVQAVSSAQSFTRNTWIHLAAYWSDRSNKSYLFINGVNDGYSTNYWYAQTLPTNMYFGSDYDGTNTGEMSFDDLRIYDHTMTAEDIKRLYGSASDPSASTLRVEIPFTSGGTGINGTGLYSLTGSFTAAFGYHAAKPTTEYGLGIFGSDNLQYGRGTQVDGIVYESFDGYQGTIKTWVKPSFDGSDATTNVILQNGDASNYIKLYYSSGTLNFTTYTSNTTYTTYKSVADWTAGTWYHVAAVWSNENAVTTGATTYLTDLYVNGSNTGTTHSNDTFGTNFWAAFAPSATTFVGEDKDGANQFNGIIGGLAIDNRPWSGDTILADYNSGSGTSSAVSSETRFSLVGPNETTRSTSMVYWPIVESTGNLITDGNMEDGDVAEFSSSANAYVNAESGTVADEDGLVGGWNFEEASTPAVDVSGNSNSLIWNGTAARATGRYGYAIDLDGDSDYLNKTDADSLDLSTAATIEAWVKLDDLAAQHSLIDKGTNYGVHIDTSGYLVWDNGTEYKDTTAISATAWTHIVITNDGTTAKYYVNGIYSSSDTTGFAAINASDLRIGYDGTYYFQGLIDGLRIYNRALSASEIAAHYSLGRNKFDNYSAKIKLAADDSNSYLDESLTNGSDYLLSYWYKMGEDNINPINFTVSGAGAIAAEQNLMSTSASGLVGAWNFEEGSGSTVADLSGNGNNGTITNATWSTSGKFGKALSFDGDGDYVSMGNGASLQAGGQRTISVWIKPTDVTTSIAHDYLYALGNNFGGGFTTELVCMKGNKISFYNATVVKEINGIISLLENTWYHIVATMDANNLSLYINGQLDIRDSFSGNSFTSSKYVLIGSDSYASVGFPERYFSGLIDSPRIYNRALTASEIYDSYKAGNWLKYEVAFEADQTGAHLFKFIQNGATAGNSIVYVDQADMILNKVDKGGFEGTYSSGVAPGWTKAGTVTVAESASAHSGSKAQSVTAGDTSNNVYQTISGLTSGNWYTFSGYGKVDSGSAYLELSGATAKTLTVTNTQYLILNTLKYTFQAASTSLTIELYAASGKVGTFDDISLVNLGASTAASVATPSSEANSYATGKWGSTGGDAFRMDGGDRLRYSASGVLPNDAGTISIWWKPMWDWDKFDQNVYILNSESASANLIRVFYDYTNHYYTAALYNGANWTTAYTNSAAPQTFTEDSWQHIVVSYDNDVDTTNGSVVLYINGASSGAPYTSTKWTVQTVPDYFYPGSLFGASANTNQAAGYLDDIRIYSGQTSAANINAIYGINPNPPTGATWKRNLVAPIIQE